MRLPLLLPLAAAAALPLSPPTTQDHHTPLSPPNHHIPTPSESAALARHLLATHTTAHLSTTTRTHPFSLPDYYADCAPTRGDPILLAMPIAQTFRNVAAGSKLALSIQPHDWDVSKPRMVLVGEVEPVPEQEWGVVEECYLKVHPEARWWKPPGESVHRSWWARVRTERVYWVGGFGDRAWIGWIGREEWLKAGEDGEGEGVGVGEL